MLIEHFLASREEAAQLAAKRIADALREDLAAKSEASLVVSGGSTPKDTFDVLAASVLPWERVHIVPSDERWVPPAHAESNERMLRETLLAGRAAKAKLLPLYREGVPPAARCKTLATELAALPLPFSSVLLGMGEDGHFASLFPDIVQAAKAFDPDCETKCLAIRTAASTQERISLTLSMLVQSREILLLFFGEAKRLVFDGAKQSHTAYPIRHLLQQPRSPVHLIWAP